MQILAVFQINGQWFVKVGNQWGDYHKGEWWFIITAEVFSKWIRRADCRTIGEIKGRSSMLEFPM